MNFGRCNRAFAGSDLSLLSYLEGSLRIIFTFIGLSFLVICLEFGRLLSYQQLLLNFRIVKNFVVVVVGILFRSHHLHWMTF